MRCIDAWRGAGVAAPLALVVLGMALAAHPAASGTTPVDDTLFTTAGARPLAKTPAITPPPRLALPPPQPPADAHELRVQFARRLVAAHPDSSYMRPAPDRLLAIPVLEVELNANGSVRRIVVLRRPSTGNEATVLAIAAVRRAAPYGDVSRLPKPWKVVETFLFDDQMHFKPRTLDL